MDYKKFPRFNLEGVYEATCVRVYDGDTADFVFSPCKCKENIRFSCRMLGYNSAEIRTKDPKEKEKAIKSKEALASKILYKKVFLQVLNKNDKYGRLLGTVTLNGENINDWMVTNGHGKVYKGRGKKNW
jgi:endonuclease YncB( thermonuclease family)